MKAPPGATPTDGGPMVENETGAPPAPARGEDWERAPGFSVGGPCCGCGGWPLVPACGVGGAPLLPLDPLLALLLRRSRIRHASQRRRERHIEVEVRKPAGLGRFATCKSAE
jgi:hypothetical protein